MPNFKIVNRAKTIGFDFDAIVSWEYYLYKNIHGRPGTPQLAISLMSGEHLTLEDEDAAAVYWYLTNLSSSASLVEQYHNRKESILPPLDEVYAEAANTPDDVGF